ncbi:MAG TPA: membrane dipeptidase [Firmicutes bacterium]|nr:membrane dipeptidase [Bacillota bacterium]
MDERARQLHQDALVVDTHCDTLLRVLGRAPYQQQQKAYRLADRHEEGHIDLPRMKEGGVDVQFFAAYIEPIYKPDRSLKRTMQIFDAFFTELDANSDSMMLATTVQDILTAKEQGKIAAVLAIEGGEALEGDLGVLRMFHRLGVRSIGLTWNERNDIADGVGDARSKGGLSAFGAAVIEEMNRLGILVDVSHLSDPGFWDAVEISKHPIIASHSNARAVCNHRRNLTDEQIKALAKNGGVMGMNFAAGFVKADGQPTLDDLLDHIDHIVQLVGPHHVGLGSDFDGIGATPEGLNDVTSMPLITEGLVKRGYSDEHIRLILGENYLRVFREVWG